MKKVTLLLLMSFIYLNSYSQYDFIKLDKSKLISDSYKPLFNKKFSSRVGYEVLALNYINSDASYHSYSFSNSVFKGFSWDFNSVWDSLVLPSDTTSGYYGKYFAQGFNTLNTFLPSGDQILYDKSKSEVRIDSVNMRLRYNRKEQGVIDTFFAQYFEDSFALSVSPSVAFNTGFNKGIKLIKTDTIILDKDTTFIYNGTDSNFVMFTPNVTLTKGAGFIIQGKFVGHKNNSISTSAFYNDICDDNGIASQSQFGYSYYGAISYFSGTPNKFSIYNSSTFNVQDSNCNTFYTQNYYIIPYVTLITQDPYVSASSNQGSLTTLCPGSSVSLLANAVGFDTSATLTYSWTPTKGLDDATSANPTATVDTINTQYIVTVSDGTKSVKDTIVVNNFGIKVTLDKTTVDLTSCTDNNKTVKATVSGITNGVTYEWSVDNNDSSTSPKLKKGTNVVTVTNVLGCTATATVTINLPADLTNTVDFSFTPTKDICPKTEVSFENKSSATTDWDFEWFEGTTSFSNSETPENKTFANTGSSNKKYTLKLVAKKSGCEYSATKDITILPASNSKCKTAGIESNNIKSNELSIYPNPSYNGKFTIENKNNINLGIEITDVLGKKIMIDKINGMDTKDIDVNKYGNGVYFIEFNGAGHKIVKKVIIDTK